jgi:hypothetical protein
MRISKIHPAKMVNLEDLAPGETFLGEDGSPWIVLYDPSARATVIAASLQEGKTTRINGETLVVKVDSEVQWSYIPQ